MSLRTRLLAAAIAVTSLSGLVLGTAPARAALPTKVMLETSYQMQQKSYYCGPASVRHALSAVGRTPSQKTLADSAHLKTDRYGLTRDISDVTRVLNMYVGGYRTIHTPEAFTATGKKLAWERIRKSIASGHPVVVGVHAGPGGLPWNHGTIDHYITVSGYDTTGAHDRARIVDSAEYATSPRYWLTWSHLATLIDPWGYSYYAG